MGAGKVSCLLSFPFSVGFSPRIWRNWIQSWNYVGYGGIHTGGRHFPLRPMDVHRAGVQRRGGLLSLSQETGFVVLWGRKGPKMQAVLPGALLFHRMSGISLDTGCSIFGMKSFSAIFLRFFFVRFIVEEWLGGKAQDGVQSSGSCPER